MEISFLLEILPFLAALDARRSSRTI